MIILLLTLYASVFSIFCHLSLLWSRVGNPAVSIVFTWKEGVSVGGVASWVFAQLGKMILGLMAKLLQRGIFLQSATHPSLTSGCLSRQSAGLPCSDEPAALQNGRWTKQFGEMKGIWRVESVRKMWTFWKNMLVCMVLFIFIFTGMGVASNAVVSLSHSCFCFSFYVLSFQSWS